MLGVIGAVKHSHWKSPMFDNVYMDFPINATIYFRDFPCHVCLPEGALLSCILLI